MRRGTSLLVDSPIVLGGRAGETGVENRKFRRKETVGKEVEVREVVGKEVEAREIVKRDGGEGKC